MLATMESVELLERADDLARCILESEPGEEYLQAFYTMKKDALAQDKIKKFASLKELFEEVQRFGRYHPDYKRVNMEIRQLKRDMDMYPAIAAFKKAETNLQSLLDEVSMMVGRAVSPNIKVPAGSPFFESASSCGSGCGSGGSCGCSA